MKKIRNTLILLMAMMTVNCSAVIHVVYYSPGNATDTCNIGDTIRFTNNNGMYSINAIFIDTISTATNILPTGTNVPPGSYYDYVITGSLSAGTHTYYMALFWTNYSTGTFVIPGTVTGIHSIDENNMGIKVFPNPVLNELTVKTSLAGTLRLFNFDGQLILTTEAYPGENKIDIESLSSGLYFATFKNKRYKIIKE